MDFCLSLEIWEKILVKTSKYSQKLLQHAKHCARDAFKTSSNRAIQKAAEASSDFTGNKIADRIRKALKTSPQNNSETNEGEVLKERYISHEKRQQIINDLRLI